MKKNAHDRIERLFAPVRFYRAMNGIYQCFSRYQIAAILFGGQCWQSNGQLAIAATIHRWPINAVMNLTVVYIKTHTHAHARAHENTLYKSIIEIVEKQIVLLDTSAWTSDGIGCRFKRNLWFRWNKCCPFSFRNYRREMIPLKTNAVYSKVPFWTKFTRCCWNYWIASFRLVSAFWPETNTKTTVSIRHNVIHQLFFLSFSSIQKHDKSSMVCLDSSDMHARFVAVSNQAVARDPNAAQLVRTLQTRKRFDHIII